ncbi:hypothetical protein ACE1B6_08480 [Aerosakkonemataceae cyanobacterium BLCC-F154]|uniref:Uncharacterized protein n=1 Tax=Floridaenema fluviatile BLCC-F154 TaxID=3153640 RepID=A0ABV4Y904_9CYAN
MFSKFKFPLLIVVFLLFVLLGDRIPFQPIGNASLQTRTTLNNFMLGLFPKKQPKNPYERTEKAIERTEEGNQ